jgi:hypothetical protein
MASDAQWLMIWKSYAEIGPPNMRSRALREIEEIETRIKRRQETGEREVAPLGPQMDMFGKQS